jgi:P22 coat protein - gene protein 5
MSNSFANLIPSIYSALDVVSRELVGFIPAVNRSPSPARAALGESVTFFIPGPMAAGDIAPATYGPAPADTTMGSDSLQITKARGVSFYYTGEDETGLNNGAGLNPILQGQLSQAFRTLTNEIELTLAGLLNFASRAYSVASGHIFDSTDQISSIAQVRRILSDNGAPIANGDLHIVLDTGFAAALRSISVLYKANESGTTDMLRFGALGSLLGFDIHESGGLASLTEYAGTPSGLVIDGTGNITKGSTSLKLKTGTGFFKKGDIVTIGADTTQRYVVQADGTTTSLVINNPGVVTAIADTWAVAKVGSITSYMPIDAFSRNALTLVTRAPALPVAGDAGDHHIVTDPLSGLSFDVARYAQYHREAWEVSIAYGVKCTKQEHLALIMGT